MFNRASCPDSSGVARTRSRSSTSASENEQTPNGFKVPLNYLVRSPEGQVEVDAARRRA